MPSVFQDVTDFHVKYGIDYNGPPRHLPPDLQRFRAKFLEEECVEYWDAVTVENSASKKVDAIFDMIYVGLGELHLMGLTPEMMAEGWRRVHEANMSKVRGADFPELSKRGGHPMDIVKPPGWVAPDHTDLCPPDDTHPDYTLAFV